MSKPDEIGTVSPVMVVKKAVITAAGAEQRALPLQTLVDRGGEAKTVLSTIAGEAIDAGAEEIAVVVRAGDEGAYAAAAGDLASKIRFVPQVRPRGFGHAVACAAEFVGDEPFLLMVSDHVFVSGGTIGCAKQLVELAGKEECSVSAVQATHESKLSRFGVIGGQRVHGRQGLYEVAEVVEKPTPTEAEQGLVVPGLRAGQYLCFFGIHVLMPTVFGLLDQAMADAGEKAIDLSGSLARLAARGRYLAFEIDGRRYDIDARYGLLEAQLAMGLAGEEREEILSMLVELLAKHRSLGV